MCFSDSNKSIYIIKTTEVDQKNASRIADLLLLDKLIPCVSFKNIESCFWWEGEINHSKEVQLIVKCKEKNLYKVCQKIAYYHSYQLPEIIYFPVSTNKSYYDWVNSF